MQVISIEGVKATSASQPLSFSAGRGEVVVLRGENQSGKSSLIDRLTGFRPLLTGAVHIGPYTNHRQHWFAFYCGRTSNRVRLRAAGVSRTFQDTRLFWGLSTSEHIVLHGRPLRPYICRALLAGIDLSVDVVRLSDGHRRRVSVALALDAAETACIMDEPMSSLDDATRGRFVECLEERCRHGLVAVLAEHRVDQLPRSWRTEWIR